MSFLTDWFSRTTAFVRVLLGLLVGIFTGLFFGEPAGVLAIGGKAYIGLLQMTVLPYVLVSLASGLGSLDAVMARRIGIRGGLMILTIWSVTLLTLTCLPLAYPDWTSAAFFSSSLLVEPAAFDPLALYLPSNPFYSLGHGVVPAVVLFSIFIGLALIPVQGKDGLIRGLESLSAALMNMASFVGKLAPLGIFAISASAAGTLEIEELSRLQVFLWVYLTAWMVLAGFTLPAMVAWATPFTYRQVLRESQVAMVTAFATGTVLVVLPMIAERCKALLAEKGIDSREANTTIDVMAPTAYSFPSAGTLLGLGFVLFAAWYVGTPLSVDQYPAFTLIGALVSFGSMAVAIPFMLDFFSLSADLFQLYLLGSVVTARFATALAALNGMVVCLLAVMAVLGQLKVRAVLIAGATSVTATLVVMTALGLLLTRAIPHAYQGEDAFVSMTLLGQSVEASQLETFEPLSEDDLERSRLAIIRERGTLHVGYLPDQLPFVYRSSNAEIVGFDADLCHQLAGDLGVGLEFVRLEWNDALEALQDGRIDLMIGGLFITPERAQQLTFSRSYFDQALGFAVRDSGRDDFLSIARMREMGRLRIGTAIAHYQDILQAILPQAEVVVIESRRKYYRGELEDVDVLATSAQAGAAWTLIYPAFSITVPQDLRLSAPTALGLPPGQEELARFVDTWLLLVEKNGFLARLDRHWIQGMQEGEQSPRWSILNDVLGFGQAQEADAAPAP